MGQGNIELEVIVAFSDRTVMTAAAGLRLS